MSADNTSPTTNNSSSNNKPPSPPPADMHRNRRGSVTSAAFANLFQRSNSTTAGTPVFPSAITSAALNEQRRRQSLNTTSLGLSGTSPTGNPSFARRASLSTNNSDSVDENAIEEEDYPFTPSRAVPANSFNRRMSLGASTAMRRSGGNSPGASNGKLTAQSPSDTVSSVSQGQGTITVPPSPSDSVAAAASTTSWKAQSPSTTRTDPPNQNNTTRPRTGSDFLPATQTDQGFNWSEQLRSRAESTVSFGQRPSFSLASGLNGSPPRTGAVQPGTHHDRARSVSDMPVPPASTPKPRSPPRDTRPKPDHFQERILKGDFYMD